MSNAFFSKWSKWGLPAFAAALSPWQDKITHTSLISDWFQPEINTVASIVGPLVCLVAFGALHKASRRRQQRLSIICMLAFFACLIICLFLRYTLGVIWFPPPYAQMVIWGAWATIYLALFALFGLTIVAATLATPESASGSQRPPS